MSWLPKKNVVVPIDFSDQSIAAVELALDLVESASGVHVIHVLPHLLVAEPGVVWDTLNDDSRRNHATSAIKERLSDAMYANVCIHVVIGDPGQETTDYAQEIGADLIVLPSHGRTGLKRILIGSVAERVVRLAHCPVLVIRS